jgi:hypothetical protein
LYVHSYIQIESLFRRPIAVFPDPAHSKGEERVKAIGKNDNGRHILIVFTRRRRKDETLIRSISARYMRQKEVQYYEEEAAKTQH